MKFRLGGARRSCVIRSLLGRSRPCTARPSRHPARPADGRRQLGEPAGALLARARSGSRGDGARLGHQHGRAPAPRRAALPHLARVHRQLRLPRPARARDARRSCSARTRASSSRRPFGLVVAGVFAAASALELAPERAPERRPTCPTPACGRLRADGGLGSRLARRAPAARRPARGRGARRLAARARRGRPRVYTASRRSATCASTGDGPSASCSRSRSPLRSWRRRWSSSPGRATGSCPGGSGTC